MKIDAKVLEECGRAAHVEAAPGRLDQWQRLGKQSRKRWVDVARAVLVAAGVEVVEEEDRAERV